MQSPADTIIRSSRSPLCCLCRHPGRALYDKLRDRLFGAPGEWSMVQCSNPACGLIWLDPMPMEDDITAAYRQYYTHSDTAGRHLTLLVRLFEAAKRGYLGIRYGYGRDRLATLDKLAGLLLYFHPWRRAIVDFNVMWLTPVANGRLLDIGCGGGGFLSFIGQLGWNGEGLDFDVDAVENAASKGLKVHVGPVEAQAFSSNAFDAVTMSHVIEHVYRPAQLIEECNRILKPGGRLVIVTPNSHSLGHRLYRKHWRGLEPPRHLQIFNARNLQRLTQDAGFRTIKLFTSMRDAYGIFLSSQSLRRGGIYMPALGHSAGLGIFARAMAFIEGLLLNFTKEMGEEIVLIAEK